MKQTIYVICETRDAYASFIGITDALRVKDGETPKSPLLHAAWYMSESNNGKKPVKLKTDMTFEDFTLFVYAMAMSAGKIKLYCQDGLFVLR